jgi:hypothetical protein
VYLLLFLHCRSRVLRHRQTPGHTISTNTTNYKTTGNTIMTTFTTVNNLR